jgi:protein-L-isoaspartate O-methyltransferase
MGMCRTRGSLGALALLLAGYSWSAAWGGEDPFVTAPNCLVLVRRGLSPTTLAGRVAHSLQVRDHFRGSRMPEKTLGWMSRLPRSVVYPEREGADLVRVLPGHPKASNPLHLALLGSFAENLPPGAHLLGLGFGLYPSALFTGLTAEVRGRTTIVERDPVVAERAESTLQELVARGDLPRHARWEVRHADAATYAPASAEQFDRILLGFALPPQQSKLVARYHKWLTPSGYIVFPLQEARDTLLQTLYVKDASGNQVRTGRTVSFEQGTFD